MQTRVFHKATENLVKWSLRDEWSDLQVEMYAGFFAPVSAVLGLSPDDIVDRLGDASDMLYAFMAEEFFTARFGDDDGSNVVDDYLKRRGWRETAPGRRYLEALRDSTVSLYEVVDIDRGRSLTVRDLIRETEPVVAHEKLGSENASLRDCLATRVVSVNGRHFLGGAMLRIPRAVSQELVAEFEKTAEGLAKDIRDELGRRGDRTPVKPGIVRDAVLRIPLSAPLFAQNWMVHSLTRGRASELPTARLADFAGRPPTSLRESGAALEDTAGTLAEEPGLPPEIANEAIHGYFDAHYRHVLDDSLPEFDGRTPRQAAATEPGRRRVIDWLKDIENAESRRAAQQGFRPYDTAWIWRELGIDAAR